MYLDFFGFKDKPFSILPDARFLYMGKGHRECFYQILSGLQANAGLVVLTGGLGTGKTTLCRSILGRLSPIYKAAWVFEPHLDGAAFLKRINKELGISCEHGDEKSQLDALRGALLDKKRSGWRIVLVVEAAQNISYGAAELIAALSGEESGGERLLQIILVGRKEFARMLDGESFAKLRGMVAVWSRLSPLSCDETAEYVAYRMSVVGAEHAGIFPAVVINEIYKQSKGVPRLVNLLCDGALQSAYSVGRRRLDVGMVGGSMRSERGRTAGAGMIPRLAQAMTVMVFMAVLWTSLSSGFLDEGAGGKRVKLPQSPARRLGYLEGAKEVVGEHGKLQGKAVQKTPGLS